MQSVIKIMKLPLMLAAIVTAAFIIGTVPPLQSPAQQAPQKDTVLQKTREMINRFEVVKSKIEQAAILVDSNAVKAQEIVAILDKVKTQKSIKYILREAPKKKEAFIKAPPDTTLYYVDGQYVDKPVIIYRTCDITYGGDTFRTNMWKAPGEDGLLKGIKFFNWLKKQK